jgi:hypothetical protein
VQNESNIEAKEVEMELKTLGFCGGTHGRTKNPEITIYNTPSLEGRLKKLNNQS